MPVKTSEKWRPFCLGLNDHWASYAGLEHYIHPSAGDDIRLLEETGQTEFSKVTDLDKFQIQI